MIYSFLVVGVNEAVAKQKSHESGSVAAANDDIVVVVEDVTNAAIYLMHIDRSISSLDFCK